MMSNKDVDALELLKHVIQLSTRLKLATNRARNLSVKKCQVEILPVARSKRGCHFCLI